MPGLFVALSQKFLKLCVCSLSLYFPLPLYSSSLKFSSLWRSFLTAQLFLSALGKCVLKMNRWGYQQKSSVAACEEGRIGMVLMEDSVVCPKPRRLSVLNSSLNDHIRSRRLSLNYQSVMGDSRAGSDLLDMILNKGDYSVERSSTQVALSPPFYCGSPPSRATNPVTQDTQFGNEKVTTTTFAAAPSLPSFSARKGSPGGGSCVRVNFGHTQAPLRIEGFDCLSRDQRNRSVSAVA